MLNTCFLELLIKMCHAVINSFKNVTGCNPHQGKRETASFPLQWIIGLGKDTDSRENSSDLQRQKIPPCVCRGFGEPAVTFTLCSPVSAPQASRELGLECNGSDFLSLFIFIIVNGINKFKMSVI